MRPPCYYLLEEIVILGVIYGRLVWRVCNLAAPAGPRGIPGLSPGKPCPSQCLAVLHPGRPHTATTQMPISVLGCTTSWETAQGHNPNAHMRAVTHTTTHATHTCCCIAVPHSPHVTFGKILLPNITLYCTIALLLFYDYIVIFPSPAVGNKKNPCHGANDITVPPPDRSHRLYYKSNFVQFSLVQSPVLRIWSVLYWVLFSFFDH